MSTINVHHNGQSCRHNHRTIRSATNCYRLHLRMLGIPAGNHVKGVRLTLKTTRR